MTHKEWLFVKMAVAGMKGFGIVSVLSLRERLRREQQQAFRKEEQLASRVRRLYQEKWQNCFHQLRLERARSDLRNFQEHELRFFRLVLVACELKLKEMTA